MRHCVPISEFVHRSLDKDQVIKVMVLKIYPLGDVLTRLLVRDLAEEQKLFITVETDYAEDVRALYFSDILIIGDTWLKVNSQVYEHGEIAPHLVIRDTAGTFLVQRTQFGVETNLDLNEHEQTKTWQTQREEKIAEQCQALKFHTISQIRKEIDRLQSSGDQRQYILVRGLFFIQSLSEPRQSRGTDRVMSLHLVDFTSITDIVVVNLFDKTGEFLPYRGTMGNVIQVHQLKIHLFNGKLQGINTRRFGFVLYDSSLSILQKHRTENMDELLAEAQDIFQELVFRCNAFETTEKRRIVPFSDLHPNTYLDFVGRVVEILGSERADKMVIVLTDHTTNKTFKTRLVKCFVWDNPESILLLNVGDVVHLKNAHSKIHQGEMILAIHSNSGGSVEPLDPNDNLAIELVHRGSGFEDSREKSCRLAHSNQGIPFSTLGQIQQTIECPVLFRCRVKIVHFFPSNIRDHARPTCVKCRTSFEKAMSHCTRCSEALEWKFMFGLVVQDHTSQLPVLCHGKSAEQLLNMPASNPRDNDAVLRQMQVGIMMLFHDEDQMFDLCLASHYKLGTGEIRYSLCETRMVLDESHCPPPGRDHNENKHNPQQDPV